MSAAFAAAAFGGQPLPAPSPPPPATTGTPNSAAQASGKPDDEFIEFLGADDVGDAAWWEFLKNSAPRKRVPPPVPPPQDASHD